jgi:thiamine kinase-like enzyme
MNDKVKIMDSIIDNLNTIHRLEKSPSNIIDMEEIYFNKTFNRVNSVKDVIPYYSSPEIVINEKKCINPFHNNHIELFKKQIRELYTNEYNIIHGDCTFSNIIIDNCKSFFIDPRGSFGYSKLYGDKNYDWAKLYYSVNGNYDSINSKKFNVNVSFNEIDLSIKSNNFEEFSSYLIEKSGMTEYQMYLQHSLIWLSLTGYVKEDIDSIIYSFYKGIYEWNKALEL